ncbi:LptF/LptG family permease [Mariniblastus sp.]|nr:LptF/LptG family permease [Mariniblastus sp.]
MTILDRYLLKLFIKIYVVCFLCFSGLFIVIHLFSNLDHLADLASSEGGWATLIQKFYVPRLVDIFDKTSAMMALFAAILAVTLMQRRREVTAIQASGLPLRRILRPVLLFSLIIVAVAAVNREWLLPQYRDQLVRTPKDWAGNRKMPISVSDDWRSGVRLRGNHVVVSKGLIDQPDVQLPFELPNAVTRLRAKYGKIEPATAIAPAGLLLSCVLHPADIGSMASVTDGKSFGVWTSADQDWLYENQCFVACDFDAEKLAYGSKLDEFRTIPELMSDVRAPQSSFGRSDRLALHARLLKPLLDLTLVLLGLPIVLSQTDRNVFVSAGLCFLIVGVFHLSVTASHSFGSYRILQPAALAAWLPVLVFGPLAVLSMRKLS